MNEYRLIALDMDGTLLDPKSNISAHNRRQIERARRAGIQIALCTGRNLSEVRLFLNELTVDWLILSSGAYICRMDGTDCIAHTPMERSLCEAFLHLCAQYHGSPCLYTADRLYYGDTFAEVCDRLRAQGNLLRLPGVPYSILLSRSFAQWHAVLRQEQNPFYKAIVYTQNEHDRTAMLQALTAHGGFTLAPTIMFDGFISNIEVNRKGTHKGAALRTLACHLGIPLGATMAIGDSENDITMLRTAGLSVAMANASPSIRALAHETTQDNAHDGVAHAISRLVFADDPNHR